MLPALFLYFALVNDVREMIARNDFAGAERLVRAQQKQSGSNPETAAAISWLARAALSARQLDRADALAVETRKLSDQLLKIHKLDADPWLPTAFGAAIEVHAQVLAARGQTAEAVSFLREQVALFASSSIHERIQKNLNLLSMEGKAAPTLVAPEWLGPKPPALATLKGHPVLLFFWAHWCSDCKAEIPILAEMRRVFGPKGLVILAPTNYYGYVARGESAAPAVEKKYIEAVRRQYYGPLGDLPAPLAAANFRNYGASTTPTLVLIDRQGIVRMYHPGNMSGADLAARIQPLIAR